MPNPKRRHSAQRGAKRRTHYKATAETFSIDAVTGESHLRHRGHWVEDKLYYRGRVVLDKNPQAAENTEANNG